MLLKSAGPTHLCLGIILQAGFDTLDMVVENSPHKVLVVSRDNLGPGLAA